MYKKILKRIAKPLLATLIILALLTSATIVSLDSHKDNDSYGLKDIFTIGYAGIAYAAGTPDYTCNGVNDDIEYQQAINALPASGGQISILTGTYNFSNTVSRAIDNITIQGVGLSCILTNDGITPIFDAGVQSDWVFKDFKTDNGGIDVSTAVYYSFENVAIGSTQYYAYYSSDDIVADEWNIPSGRHPTYILSASDSSASSIAQSDYKCGGASDETDINTAIASLLTPVVDEAIVIGDFDEFDDLDDPVSGGGSYTWVGLQGDETLSQDVADKAEGAASLKVVTFAGTGNSGAKVTGMGGEDWSGYDTVSLYVKTPHIMGVRLYFYDQAAGMASYMTTTSAADTWEDLEFYIGCDREHTNTLDWTDIDQVKILFNVTSDYSYTARVDWFRFNTWNETDHKIIAPGSYTLSSASGGGGVDYVENTDYIIELQSGRIRALVDGAIVSGSTCYIDYAYGSGVIGLTNGTYHIDGVITYAISNLTLLGLGDSVIIHLDDGADTNLLTVAGDNWRVVDIIFDGNNDGQSVAGDRYGIRCNGYNGLTLDNVEMVCCGSRDVAAIRLDDCEGTKIRDSRLLGKTSSGILATDAVYNVQISDSIFRDHSKSAIILWEGCEDWTIADCSFYYNGYCDLNVGEVAACADIHLVDCVSYKCFEGSGLFRFKSSSNCTVTGGAVYDCPDFAGYVSGCDNISITGLDIKTCYYAIEIYNSDFVTFDAHVEDSFGTPVSVTGTSGWAVIRGIYINCGDSSVFEYSPKAAAIISGSGGYNDVSITVVDDRGVGAVMKSGVVISVGDANKVHDCVFSGLTGGYGILIISGDDHKIVNNLIESDLYGIRAIDGDDLIISWNRIIGATNSIEIDNANVVRAMVAGNNWEGCTNDLVATAAVNPRVTSNIDKNGAWYATGDAPN